MSEKLEPIHPADAWLDAVKKMFPGREVDQASVDRLRAICDEMVDYNVSAITDVGTMPFLIEFDLATGLPRTPR